MTSQLTPGDARPTVEAAPEPAAAVALPKGHVFISYKTEDRARVKPLVDALEAAGVTVWWDLYIHGGAAWREVVQENLEAAACVVVVWSTLSAGPAGRFVQDEAARADRRGVYLPVSIDPVEPPLGFGQVQVLSLDGWRGARTDRRFLDVLDAVRALTEGGPNPRPKARAGAARLSALGRPWRALGVLALVLILAAAGLAVVKGRTRLCRAMHLPCAGAPAAAHNSIAVLPFANLSGDTSQDYFSDGLSEELLSALARIDKLQVAARTSAFKFRGGKDDSAAIGAKLGVAYILDGSVRRDGKVVRVSAELVDARSGFEKWSQTYDRNLDDILQVQGSIAQSVADALTVKLLGGDVAALSRGGASNAEAYDAYLKGRRLFDQGGQEANYRQALAQFEQALSLDANFAAAEAARSRSLQAIANQFASGPALRQTYAAALASAKRAVGLSPDLAEAQIALGGALQNGALDFRGARQAYARAMASGAGNADVLQRVGLFNCRDGDTDAGLAALRRAVELDQLNPRAYKSLGFGLLAARRYPESIAAMRQALELSPNTDGAHATIGDALLAQGDVAGARREYDLEPAGWRKWTSLAIILRKQGDAAGAEQAFKALMATGEDASAFQQAEVFAQWGQSERALAALDKAFRTGDSGLVELKTDPLMDPLRQTPGFDDRLRRARF